MDRYIENRQTAEDRVESIIPYLSYERWIEEKIISNIKDKTSKLLSSIMEENHELSVLEDVIKESNVKALLENKEVCRRL